MLIWTTKGLIERERLEVKDITTETDNSRDTATEWYLNGELVRRDAHINMLRPLNINSDQGQL